MILETLETRSLFNATLNADGLLRVEGSGGDDNVMVWQPQADVTRVDHNGVSTDFATADVQSIIVNTAGGNDTVVLGRRAPNATLIGGSGNDSLSAGDGNDRLYGDEGDDYLFGRDGNDEIDGGLGADEILGGDGRDTADYSLRTAPVDVWVGVAAFDGEADEHDNVRLDIETVIGGSGNDRLKNMGTHSVVFYGGPGDDELTGNSGNDALYGGPGSDQLRGIGGINAYHAADGEIDTIFGGAGLDTVDVDEIDLVMLS